MIFFLGLFFMGNGIAMVTNAQLGTTPISSVPYVVGKIFGFSIGTGTFTVNIFMLLAQIPLLGKHSGHVSSFNFPVSSSSVFS